MLPTWPLAAAFGAYPLWWVLGAGWLAWPTIAVFMLVEMGRAGTWRIPGGFGLWMLFLASTLLSALMVHGGAAAFSWAFNEVGYLSATVFFLYVYNLPRSPALLPRYLAIFWMYTIVGGFVAVLFPHLGFVTPINHLLPGGVRQNALADRFTNLRLADSSSYGKPRPEAPFAYSNRWGSVLALTTPVAVFVAMRTRRKRRRLGVVVLSVVGVLPIVYSLDRGLWLALALAIIYALIRSVRRGRGKALLGVVTAIVVLSIGVLVTSLGDLASSKVTNPYAYGGRLDSYSSTWNGFLAQPWIGHGTTGSVQGIVTRGHVPVGTQGQFWTLIYTSGLLGTIPFFLWFIYVLVKTIHVRTTAAAVFRIACALPLVLCFVYGFVPESLMVMMVCQGALLRISDLRTPTRSSESAPRAFLVV